jgi:hypothetical protein
VYLDDILIYSKNKEEYKKYVEEVLRVLLEAGIRCKLSKYEVILKEVGFLEYVLKLGKVAIDISKVSSILE